MEVHKRHPKKSAFSCEACRKRKVKCDAGHPICKRCHNRDDVCIYKLSPTLSYTHRLEQQVAQLEAELSAAKGTAVHYPKDQDIDVHPSSSGTSPLPGPQAADALIIENDRRVYLHGSTSLFQLPGRVPVHAVEHGQAEQEMAAKKDSLVNSAWRERAFEKLADIPEPFRSLIDSHFCWIQPLFNFVYRPAFTRDMKSGGPYFSQALLNAVLSHSVRWCRGEPGMDELLAPFDNGATFSRNAVRDLFEDVQHGNSKIPTVQALLLLSAQECGCGNRTQAWLYSGMAFRLIDDMGICVDSKRYADAGRFSPEDVEIRIRLFWSCYFWDKLISLYFGRSPMIQNSEISPPRVIMDDTAEIEPWTPHGLLSPNYPPKQAHSISCFIQTSALAEILNQILIHLYNPSQDLSPSSAYQCALTEGSKLRDWWQNLPSYLKINLAAPHLECPPSHIVTLNCLYHTINILLNRAKLKLGREPADTNPWIHCISSATSIVALFDLYTRTFGDGHVVLSLAYCVYTAASIFLLEVQAIGHAAPGTLERLSICVGTLGRLEKTNPVIATASKLIFRELEALGINLSPNTSSTFSPNSEQPEHGSQLPLSMDAYSTAPLSSNFLPITSGPIGQGDDTILLDYSYFNTHAEGSINYNLLDMPPETYEAFSQIEPIRITMDPGFDMY